MVTHYSSSLIRFSFIFEEGVRFLRKRNLTIFLHGVDKSPFNCINTSWDSRRVYSNKGPMFIQCFNFDFPGIIDIYYKFLLEVFPISRPAFLVHLFSLSSRTHPPTREFSFQMETSKFPLLTNGIRLPSPIHFATAYQFLSIGLIPSIYSFVFFIAYFGAPLDFGILETPLYIYRTFFVFAIPPPSTQT